MPLPFTCSQGGDLTPAHLALALHRGCPRPGQQSSHIVLPILFPPVLHSLSVEAIHALMALNALTSTVPNLTSNVLISERIPNCFPYRRPSIKHCNRCFKFYYVAIYSMKIYQRKNRFPHRANNITFPSLLLETWSWGTYCKPKSVLHILCI